MSNSFEFLTKGSGYDKLITPALISELMGDNLTRPPEDVRVLYELLAALEDQGLPFEWSPQEDGFLATHGRETWVDYLIYRYKMRVFPKEKIVAEFPVYLLVEPTSVCNLRCTMCFQVDKGFTKKPFMGLMDLDFYKKIIDEAYANGTKALTLASRGEPTLHPQLPEMLAYASGKFLELKLNTNATRLSEKLCHAILDAGVDELVFSIDSHDPSIYERIRVKGKFDEVVENVTRFAQIRSQHAKPRTHTRVSGVEMVEGQDPQKLVEFWGKIVDHVGLTPCEERWDTYNNQIHPDRTQPCEYLWERAYCWWDGIMNPCDVDYKSQLSVGNAKTQSIREIWHGEAYSKLRQAHLEEKRSTFVPCDRCGV